MEKELIGLSHKKRRVSFNVFKVPWWYEGIGLMFSRRKSAKALIFDLRKNVRMRIHSFFVFFPFVAVWLDENKEIVDIKRIEIFKFGILPSRKFRYLLEIPINEKYDDIIKILVDGETFK